jgi:hypothetical protein
LLLISNFKNMFMCSAKNSSYHETATKSGKSELVKNEPAGEKWGEKQPFITKLWSIHLSGTSACASEISGSVVCIFLGEGGEEYDFSSVFSFCGSRCVYVCACTFFATFQAAALQKLLLGARRPCGDTFQVLSFPTLRRLLFTRCKETLLAAGARYYANGKNT